MLNTIFYEILNLSITSSYIIICVIILRFLLKKFPKIYSFALWSVVFFRLICPFSIESTISFLPKSEIQQNDFLNANITNSNISSTFENVQNIILTDRFFIPYSVNNISLFALIWLLGVASFLILNIFSYLKLRKKLSVFLHLEKNIYLVDTIDTPFVLGIIKPKIYLPSYLSELEKSFIIPHEQYHIKRFDHISRFLAFCILVLHWFNPLVWIAFVLSGRDMELSVDEKINWHEKNENIKEYASLLLDFGLKNKMSSPLFVTPTFGNKDIHERVLNIMNFKKISIFLGGILTILVVAFVVFFSTSKLDKKYDPEFSTFMVESFVSFWYTGENTVELNEAFRDSKIAYFPANTDYFLDGFYLAHGLLPEHQQVDGKMLTFSSFGVDAETLSLNMDVLALSQQLFSLYSSDFSYTVNGSTQLETVNLSPENFGIINSTKDIPVTYGKVSLNISPVDVTQGITKAEFDLIWDELSLEFDDEIELRNAYLTKVLNFLIENYSEPVYKNPVDLDVYVSFYIESGQGAYNFSTSPTSEISDSLLELQVTLFDYLDRFD